MFQQRSKIRRTREHRFASRTLADRHLQGRSEYVSTKLTACEIFEVTPISKLIFLTPRWGNLAAKTVRRSISSEIYASLLSRCSLKD